MTGLEGLSPQELQALEQEIARLKGGTVEGQPQEQNMQQNRPQEITVTLPDGTRMTGTQEQVNAAYQRYYGSTTQKSETQAQPQGPQLATWDKDRWTNVFVDDPREGLKQAFKSMYGFDPGEAALQLAQALKTVYEQNTSLQNEVLALRNPVFGDQDKMSKIQEIVKNNGWEATPQNLQNAYDIARARGIIQETTQQPKQQEVNQFNQDYSGSFQQSAQAPPYISGVSPASFQSGNHSADEVFNMTRDLSTDQIREMISKYETQVK